jgi:hypothetical protein
VPHEVDQRGSSTLFASRWVAERFPLQHLHVATTLPGHTRGNHAHRVQREILLVLHSDRWSLYWDTGPGTAVGRRAFDGTGAANPDVVPRTVTT